jgi:hypothetical protein
MRALWPIVACLILGFSSSASARQEKEVDLPTRLKSIKGPFTLIVHLQVKKGEEKTMLEAARPCIAATRKEKGCIAYELHQDQ